MSEHIPQNWKTTQLGEIASIVSGGTPSREAPEFWGKDIPWVTPTDITNTKGRFLFNTAEGLSLLGLRSSSASPLPCGTILMTSRATVGDARIAERKVCTNQGFKSLIPSKDIDSLFLFYQMQRCREAYKVYGIGSTFLEVSKKDTERFELLLPNDLAEQQAISKILDCIDQVIEKTEALIHKYQQIKSGLMHDLFTRGVTADGKLRPLKEQAPELYQETPIGWIPKEWEFSVMGKHIEKYLYGPRFDASFYSAIGNVKTIRGTDFSKEGEILYNQAPVAQLLAAKIGRHILQEGDVVIVTTADCGLTAVFESQEMDFMPSAYTVKYRFGAEVSPYFIKYYMQTSYAKNQVNKYVRQGTLGNLPGSDLLRFWIQIPEEKEQIEIVKRLDTVVKKIAEEKNVLDKLKKQKSGLMHDLLTGKVPVKIDKAEAAHV